MGHSEVMRERWRRWAALVSAAVVLLLAGAARAQNAFDQSTGAFTSKYFAEKTAGSLFAGNPCLLPPYVYSTGASSSGFATGGAGYLCETPFPGINALEVPIVWSPNFNASGLNSGNFTELALPNFSEVVTGAATGIDSAGKNVVGIVVGSNDGITYQILPYLWQATTAGAFAGVTPTQLPLRPGDTSGAAYGISPSGQYATGWSGALAFDAGDVVTTGSTMKAVLWNVNTNSVTSLGATPDPVNSPAATGKAVADNGTVVGWFGKFPHDGFTNDINFNAGSDQPLGVAEPVDFATNWQPKPFVWTTSSGVMTQLGMTPLNNSSTTYLYGEARAINASGSEGAAGGTVAVGWLGSSLTNYEAVRWSTTSNWESSSTLQLATVQPTDPGSTGRLGSVANAVDASGLNVVGRVEYSCLSSSVGVCSQAVYWSVSPDGQSSSGATLASILASVGVNTSNVTLTDATGVTVVAHSPPEDILIVGNGVHSDGTPDIFLIQLQRPAPGAGGGAPPAAAAITSLTDQQSSLSSLGVISNEFISLTDSAMAGLATAADYYRCLQPKGVEAYQSWCGFTYGLVQSSTGTSGDQYAGTFGVARYFSASTSVGVSVGAAGLNNGLAYGGSFNAPGATFGAYFSHRPDTGLQFLAMAVAGVYPDLSVSRGYANGATALVSSQGSTHSWTDGFMARLGWSLPLFSPKTIVTPLAQISYIQSHIGGWTEDGGPFPAVINAFSGATTTLRLGSQFRTALTDKVTLFGSLLWADTLRNDLPAIQGSLVAAGCDGSTPIAAFCNVPGIGPGMASSWAEASAGVRVALSPVSVATISANLSSLYDTTFGAQVGYSHAF